MITPQEIQLRARKLWATGRPLRSLLITGDEPFFPCVIPFRRPTAQEWLEQFAELRAAMDALQAQSKAVRGVGYSLELRETAHQKLGRLRAPERIVFDSIEDLAECAGEALTLHRFRDLVALIQSREPRLTGWLADRPLAAVDCAPQVPRLLDTVAYLQDHPRPARFARELGISGVDSKFIETNRSVLSEWLDMLLPSTAIDESVRGLADRGFERRYGLRFEEPTVRFRWLDPARRLENRISDAAVPLPEFVAYAPECERVIIAENKINFLTLPRCPGTLAIFGSGYAVELLASVAWLEGPRLLYWSDVDTDGFAMLSRLRRYWPHARSFLMDRGTLLAHRDVWSEEPEARRCLRDLPALDEQEQLLYDDLRYDRLGIRVRLEQERISMSLVEEAISAHQ